MEPIYTLLSAMKGQQRQMDAVSNNLANVNTTGYKADRVLFREYYNEMTGQDLESEEEIFAHDEFISPLSRGGTSFVMPDHVSPSMAKGPYKPTENPFDLALRSDGYFVVETPHGTRYTRNGQFMRDDKGFLTNNSGHRVQGMKGDILVKGKEFSVGEDGSVLVDNKPIDTLKIVGFPEADRLTKMGNSYWAPGSAEQKPFKPEFISIEQRVLESSNVDTVKEMVDMINVNRTYEASQKLLRSLDDLDEQVISIAKV